MSGLADFITARLDEDEAMAKAAARCPLVHQDGHEDGDWSWLRDYGQPQPVQLALIDHQARFDPARVLREVTAKRAMVQHCLDAIDAQGDYHDDGSEYVATQILAALASAWSDHPDCPAAAL